MNSFNVSNMGAFEHQIEELVAFARDRDGNDRSVLYCELTDLFIYGSAPTYAEDRAQLLDVVEALVPHVAPNTRASVAAQLAEMHHPPMDLVMRLIYDDADLVANLVTKAPMDEDTLIEFIAKTGRAHHQELATRNDLSANTWIALARAAPAMPMNQVHNENALWDDSLGKHHEQKNIGSTKNAKELGIDLFMTRPAPEETVKMRTMKAPLKVIKSSKRTMSEADEDTSDFFDGKIAANDLVKTALTRREKRVLDEHVNHPMPKATVEVDDFSWDQHVNADLGWALLTNRDGHIAELSESAKTFMGLASERLIAMDIVELIGLTDRPDHPVVRALSRHGAIHDAPVVLFVGPVGRASWTLTAIPKFEQSSGHFEGFNCHFSPVALTDEDIPVFLDEIEESEGHYKPEMLSCDNITSITGEVPIISESPLFIEEDEIVEAPSLLTADPDVTDALTAAVAKNMDMSIESIREQAKSMARDKMSEIQSKLERNEINEWPTIITEATEDVSARFEGGFDGDPLEHIFEPTAPVEKRTPAPVQKQKAKPARTAPPVAKSTVSPMQDALEDLIETTRLAKGAIEREENINSLHLKRMETIKHMLSMMEEAGSRLKGKHPSDDPVTIKLDADIAKTCAKALRDLLRNPE